MVLVKWIVYASRGIKMKSTFMSLWWRHWECKYCLPFSRSMCTLVSFYASPSLRSWKWPVPESRPSDENSKWMYWPQFIRKQEKLLKPKRFIKNIVWNLRTSHEFGSVLDPTLNFCNNLFLWLLNNNFTKHLDKRLQKPQMQHQNARINTKRYKNGGERFLCLPAFSDGVPN